MLLKAEGRTVPKAESDSRAESPATSSAAKPDANDDDKESTAGTVRWKPKAQSEMSNFEYLGYYVKYVAYVGRGATAVSRWVAH